MRQAAMMRAGAAGYVFAVCLAAWSQAPTPQTPVDQLRQIQFRQILLRQHLPLRRPPETVAGGKLHGVVKSGNIPLPGVTVIAQNTLTGKRYSTTTDITGSWQLNIPQNGRYVIRTQFAAFAQGSQEAILNADQPRPVVNFQLILASRQAAQEQQQAQTSKADGAAGDSPTGRQSPENLSLMNALTADTDTGAGTAGASGAALPSIADNSDFSDESVAITGQAGQVSALAGIDPDRLRDAVQSIQAQGGLNGQGGRRWPGRPLRRIRRGWRIRRSLRRRRRRIRRRWRRLWRTRRRWRRGGRGNFRGFNPGQPHGAVAWNGTNSFFNAQPFALLGQQQNQPVQRHQPLHALVHERAVYSASDQAQRQGHRFSYALRHAFVQCQTISMPRFQPKPNGAEIFPLPDCRRSTIRLPVSSSFYNGTPNVIPPAGAAGQSISPQAAALLSIFLSRILPPAAPSTDTTTTCSPLRNRTPRRPAFVTIAAWAPTLHSPAAAVEQAAADAAGRRIRDFARASTSITTGPIRPRIW